KLVSIADASLNHTLRTSGIPFVNTTYIESFNGSLRDECLNEEIFDRLTDARRKLAIWRYDYNHVRPHSSLGNKTHAEARRALEQSEGSAPGALATPETDHYQPQGLSL
ncbi:transposase, partial [Rhodovulum sp. BSW8]|uniref:integrase core domain-containing protein n=1 Tax=Rhodovulum sp. BSW8 TaxID=2259645 RepID=UPI001FB53741